MKKTMIVLGVIAVLALSLGAAGMAYAQTVTPPQPGLGGRGPMIGTGQTGPLHTYMVNAMAESLGLSVKDLESRLTAGETFYQIALSQGIAADKIPSLMQEVRTKAVEQALADKVITQEQADWMLQHLGGARGRGLGFGPGYAPGQGPCSGTGVPVGQGMHRGSRWGQ